MSIHIFRSTLAAALVAAFLAAAPASAAILLTPADGGAGFIGPTEAGFTVTAVAPAMIYALNVNNGIYTGTGAGVAWVITAANGAAFTFAGLDVEVAGFARGALDLTLTGTPANGSPPIVATLTQSGIAEVPASLDGVSLTSLAISDFGYNDGGGSTTTGFNNLRLLDIPEPASLALLVAASAGFGLMRRRYPRARST